MTRWAYGMKQVGSREMDDFMAERLRIMACEEFAHTMWWWFEGFLGFCGICTAMHIMDVAPEGKEPGWLIPLSIASMIAIGLALKFAPRYWRTYKYYMLKAVEDKIDIFVDELGNRAEVLKDCHLIVHVNDKPRSVERRAPVRDTFDAPRTDDTQEFPARLRPMKDSGSMRERVLSEDEKRAVLRHCLGNRQQGLPAFTVMVTAIGLAPILVGVSSNEKIPIYVGIAFLAVAAFGWRQLYFHVRHERDIQLDI